MVQWPILQNGLAVLGLLGSLGSYPTFGGSFSPNEIKNWSLCKSAKLRLHNIKVRKMSIWVLNYTFWAIIG